MQHLPSLLLVIAWSSLAALGLPAGAGALAPEADLDSLGPIVDSIVIDNRNVYDTDDPKYDNFLFRLANRIHIVTREHVIRRELLFRTGEPYPYELAEESARNLRSRLALYDAWIETETLPNGHLLVRVVTIDEWTLAFGPSVRTEGGDHEYEFLLTERNVLGRNQEVRARYVFGNSEKDFVDLAYTNQRMFGRPVRAAGGYRTDPVNGVKWVELSHPYYNLTQSFTYRAEVGASEVRRDVYSDDLLIGQSFREGDWCELGIGSRTGTYRRKLELSCRYYYRFDRTVGTALIDTDPDLMEQALRSLPDDSAYHLVEVGTAFSNLDFTTQTRIDGFSYTEDFELGYGLGISYGRAFLPDFDRHAYDRLSASVSHGRRFGSNLWYGSWRYTVWLRGERDLRRLSDVYSRFYRRWFEFLTLAMGFSYRSDWRADGTEGLVMGGETGLRGYDQYFRTGDRMAVLNLEARFFPDVRIHSAVFSPVLFTDFAQRWKRGEAFGTGDVYGAIGAGLRIALEHSARARLVRVDASYSEVNSWRFSISAEQYFIAPRSGFFLTSP